MQNTAKHALTPQPSKCAALAKPMQAIASLQRQGGLSMATALKGRQLSYYRRHAGEMPLVMAVQAYILELAAAYNISRNLDEKQAAHIARTLVQEYWWLKLAEIAVFIQMAKEGLFGHCYERLDQPTLFEWLRQYCQRREDMLLEQHTERKHRQDVAATGQMLLEGLRAHYPEQYRAMPQLKGKGLRGKLQDPDFVRFRLQYEQQRKAERLALLQQEQQEAAAAKAKTKAAPAQPAAPARKGAGRQQARATA